MLISEIFTSIDGEARRAGELATFVRSVGCNLRCAYCFPAGTQIMTPEGDTVAIENLKEGDEVLGIEENGKSKHRFFNPTRVSAVMQRTSNICTIVLENGERIRTTAEHPFLAKAPYGSVRFVQAQNLKGKLLYRLPGASDYSFNMSEDWARGYIWGAFQGDGWYYKYPKHNGSKLEFATTDPDILEQLKGCLKMVYAVDATEFTHRLCKKHLFPSRRPDADTMLGLRITRTTVVEQIRADAAQCSTQLPLDWCRGYIAGMYDTDGSDNRCYVSITQSERANPEKCNLIARCLKALNKRFTRTDMAFRLRGGSYENKLWLANECGAALTRKTVACPDGLTLDNCRTVRVASVEVSTEADTVYNITTDSHTYVANNYVVHNCDSKYTWHADETSRNMTVDEIVAECFDAGISNITFTGGEPLIQKDADELIEALASRGFDVSIETNGAVDFTERKWFKNDTPGVWVCADYKGHASGETDKMLSLEKFVQLRERDVLKFVVGSEEDLLLAESIINYIRDAGSRCWVYLSPVFGMIEPSEIVDFMKDHGLQDRVRFQIQLHKVVWDPQARGC